jgi:L-asparaginase
MPAYCVLLLQTALGKLHRLIPHSVYTDYCRGIVILGVGPGGLSTTATKAANELLEQGVVTVASLRPWFGAVVPPPKPGNM